MFRTWVRRDGSINIGDYVKKFPPGTVVDVSISSAGTLFVVACDEPSVIELTAQGRGQWVLEDLMERISAEENDDVRLFAAHYLRRLRNLTPRGPSRAAYDISLAEAKRVREYIDKAWEQISKQRALTSGH